MAVMMVITIKNSSDMHLWLYTSQIQDSTLGIKNKKLRNVVNQLEV